MAKAKRAMESSTLEWRKHPGAIVVVPLADGRFGACRVLRVDPDREMSLFAATQYIGVKPPTIFDPLLASILMMDSIGCDRASQRTAGDNWPCVSWQRWCSDPPAEFSYLGTMAPAAAEQRMNPEVYSKFWDRWARLFLQEWRWEHDRQNFVAELDQKNGAGSVQTFLEEKKRLAEITLPMLRKTQFFAEWDGFVSPNLIRVARKIVKKAIDSLIALGSRPTKKQALPILQQFFESFNAEADKLDTVSRENICDVFYEIIRVAGMTGCEDLAEKWREF